MRVVLLCAALATTACLRDASFHCSSDHDCASPSGASGVCEAVSYCSFTDPACTSGRRFGDLSGSYANACVTGDSTVDSGQQQHLDGGNNQHPDGGGMPHIDGGNMMQHDAH